MSILLALAITPIAPQVPPKADFTPIEIASPDGRCVARIDRAQGQERVAANMARYQLSVFELDESGKRRELWNTEYPLETGRSKHALANRGRAFVQLAEHYSESHTVLRVLRPKQEMVKWTGAELPIERSVQGGTHLERTWLDESRVPTIAWTDGWFGPCLELDIPCRGGSSSAIDLEHMTIVQRTPEPPALYVEPAVQGTLPDRCGVPYIQSAVAPAVVRAGVGLDVSINASHPTPGWTLLGFEMEASGEDERTLVLTPRSAAPERISAQVISVFRTTPRIFNLRPGRYTIDVEGWSAQHLPLVIDVLPETLLVTLRTSGGFAGINQRADLFTQSVARHDLGRGAPARYVEFPKERLEHLRNLLAALPAKSRRAQTRDAADLFQHTFAFWSGDQWITIEVDDLAATDAERELIEALRPI